MNDVVFIKGQGGLGRPLAGEDFISGYLHYTSALPSGFSSTDRIKQVFSIDEAEDLGITNTHIGETKATATITMTTLGANGDTLAINVVTALGVVSLGTYTKTSAETTTTLEATAIAALINSGTTTHGFTAVGAAAVVTVTAPAGSGVGANSWTFSNVFTGTMAGTSSTWSGGVASQIDIIHYHINEYFTMQPKGNLYVGIYATADVATWSNVTDMQNYAEGKIRQMFVYQNTTAYATTQSTSLQGVVNSNTADAAPLEIFYQPDFSAVSLSALSDLRALNAPNVTVLIGQDGGNVGRDLWLATGKSIGFGGAFLGSISLSKVNESVSWVGKFDFSHVEYDTLAFANGVSYRTSSSGLINNVDALGYVFLIKRRSQSGSYCTRPHTNVSISSDYAFVNYNRTINKAIRGLRQFLVPQLSAPVFVNKDGTLKEDTISYFETLASRAMDAMQRDREVSEFSVVINPKQNVLSTSKLIVNVKMVPVGVADEIEVNIGFALSI